MPTLVAGGAGVLSMRLGGARKNHLPTVAQLPCSGDVVKTKAPGGQRSGAHEYKVSGGGSKTQRLLEARAGAWRPDRPQAQAKAGQFLFPNLAIR